MIKKLVQSIEFCGGPADGHREEFVGAPKPFVLVATAAHNRGTAPWTILFRLLRFQDRLESRLWAAYELRVENGSSRYHFLRSHIDKHNDLACQHVETLEKCI